MAAIAIWSIPDNGMNCPLLRSLKNRQHYFSAYILGTYQWQHWNIFSPDPLRRVTEVHIEKMENGSWVALRLLDRSHLGFFQAAPELKYLINIVDTIPELEDAYMQDICRTDRLSAGTTLRMRKRVFVIPKPDELGSIARWRQWSPEWSPFSERILSCTSPSL
jgi:hypothetical protein